MIRFKKEDSYVFHDRIQSGYVICHITMTRRDWFLRKKKSMTRTRLNVVEQYPLTFAKWWVCDLTQANVKPANNNVILYDKFDKWMAGREE